MAPAEHIKRQIAVTVVIAVEEPSLLLAVDRIVGRVEIEDDLVRRRVVRLHEEVDQQFPDRDRVMTDLVVARCLESAQFQPIECRLAGDRCTLLASRLSPNG